MTKNEQKYFNSSEGDIKILEPFYNDLKGIGYFNKEVKKEGEGEDPNSLTLFHLH
ncbi:MAG: hypothetical protein MJ232_08040 [archaeon]|nr:hypothetical protein [archaeon]